MAENTVTKTTEKKLEDIKKEAEGKRCAVQKTLYFIEEFLAGPMCGKCIPCALGSYEAKIRLIKLAQNIEGIGASDVEALRRIALQMLESSRCKKGKDTAQFMIELLEGSQEEFDLHFFGICPEKECIARIEYIIVPEFCIMCGICLEACKYDAIIGEKKTPFLSGYLPFEIRQKRCVKCGDCIKVCPTNAIVITDVKAGEKVKV
jgi:NAD-dependent dihydropyrimidine dehydrogenase PreA subunit